MCRSHFQTTRTEFDIHVIIFDHRNNAPYQRYDYFFTFQPGVFRIGRIDTHSRITHNCFRTSSSNHRITSFRISFYFIAQIIKFSMFFFINHLFVREGSQCFRVPVHHTNSPVNKSLIIKIYENLQYTFATFFVHSKCGTIPVTRCSQSTKLFQDNTTVLFGPCPGMFEKFVTGQIRLFDSFRCKSVYHLGFSCNRGMICSRYPTGIFTFHTGTTNKNILNGIIKHVSHV